MIEKVNLKNQVDILTKQKDAPSSGLKGELTNLKRSYEVISKDIEMSYKMLAASRSLLEDRSGGGS